MWGNIRSIAPKHCDLFMQQIQTLCVIVCSEFQLWTSFSELKIVG
jgi:hypothetical protein